MESEFILDNGSYEELKAAKNYSDTQRVIKRFRREKIKLKND